MRWLVVCEGRADIYGRVVEACGTLVAEVPIAPGKIRVDQLPWPWVIGEVIGSYWDARAMANQHEHEHGHRCRVESGKLP